MNKENLQTKVQALQNNLQVKHDELTVVQEQLNVARNELANVGKPKIQSKVVDDLVESLQEVFADVLNNVSTHDIDVEFGMDYGNQVVLEHIDFNNVGISESDIYDILQDMFNIVEDDDNS